MRGVAMSERLFGQLLITAILLQFKEGAYGMNTYGGRSGGTG
jgi:preprotein translocase subunit SecG